MTQLKKSQPLEPLEPLELGTICLTRGVHESGMTAPYINELLYRHAWGDWGEVCADDQATNREALKHGMRVLSAYAIDVNKPCKGFGQNCVWIITEASRQVTTLLLPEEY